MTGRPPWAPTVEDLIEINKRVLQPEYGGGRPHGINYESGLYSAVDRPWGHYFGFEPFPSPYEKAAALMDGIINNHVFDDGNKRTAFTAGVALVEYLTGRDVISTVQEEVEITLAVEQGHMSIADLAEWLAAHSAPCP